MTKEHAEEAAWHALKALVDKLELIHLDSRYASVWQMYAIHGGYYTGPRYTEELAAANRVLTEPAPQEGREVVDDLLANETEQEGDLIEFHEFKKKPNFHIYCETCYDQWGMWAPKEAPVHETAPEDNNGDCDGLFAEILKALIRAERKLSAYVGVCKGDKELTDTVLPMARAAIKKAETR